MSTLIIHPFLTTSDAEKILKSHYDMRASVIKLLSSYGDQNFYVHLATETKTICEARQLIGTEFVLKIINSEDSMQEGLIETRVKLRLFSNERGVACSKPILNIKGEYLSREKIYQQGDYNYTANKGNPKRQYGIFKVVLLTFVPGCRINSLPLPFSSSFMYDVGKFSAKLSQTLQEFGPIPPMFNSQTSQHIWNPDNCLSAKAFIEDLPYLKIGLVKQILNEFETCVIPKRAILRKGIIHGDITMDNLIGGQKKTSNGESTLTLTGIIDFGDASASYIVYDVGNLLASMMLCKLHDPIPAAGHCLAGYQSVFPLGDVERHLLRVCILARLAQIQLIKHHDIKTRPEKPHVEREIPETWELMDKLSAAKHSDVEETWSKIAIAYQD